MTILWVKVGGLWPADTGGRLRSLHLIEELSRRHTITLLTTHGREEDPSLLAARLSRCEVVSVPYAIPKKDSAAFAGALLRSWLSPLPVDLRKFAAPRLRAAVRSRLGDRPPDLCVADFLSATVNVPSRGTPPVLYFAHNVEHVIWRRLARVERRPWRRALLEVEWRKMRLAEARACARVALCVAVSAPDAASLASLAPGGAVRVVPTGVDATYFSPAGSRERTAMVFTGSMDWHPNEDAAVHFIEAILPRVREQVPDAAFTVVGRNPGSRVRAAAAGAGVQVTGTVPDVRPYVAEAAVYVVPLRIGGGTRLKIFEALAMGKAVVSTTVGAEGLPLVPGEHYLCADAPAEFARAVVTLLRDPARRAALGAAGRRLVEARYGWPAVADEFERRCAEALGRTPAPSGGSRLKAFLPDVVKRHARAHRGLREGGRSIYWGIQIRRALGLPEGGPRGAPSGLRSVLYVCRGNIIRSPMAEALLARDLAKAGVTGITVTSGGIYARRGQPADPRALQAAREFGVSLDDHRARPLTGRMIGRADRIVPMDSLVEAELGRRYPQARARIAPLVAAGAARRARPIEIPDPFDGDLEDVRRSYELLRDCVRRQAEEILSTAGADRAARRAGPESQPCA